MPDREKVVAWLTEISLRPCDFARDDFDAYETEHLANEALEICEDAKVFNQQRNDALAMLKEQEAKEQLSDAVHETAKQFRQTIVRCISCTFYRSDGECALHNGRWKPEGFCSWAIRKEGR